MNRTALARSWLFAVVLAATVALTGCGDPVTSGTIIAKDHREAYTTSTMLCTLRDENSVCMMWTQQKQHHDPRWSFTVRDDEGRKDVWQVTEAMYDKFEVGDYVTRNN